MATVLTLIKVELFDLETRTDLFPFVTGLQQTNNILLSLQPANMKNLIVPVYTQCSNNDQPSGVCPTFYYLTHCFAWEDIPTNQNWKCHRFLEVNVYDGTEIVSNFLSQPGFACMCKHGRWWS